jgi:Tfp pilus assembly protein PilF
VHHNLGIALRKQRKFDEAAREFTEALRIDPNLQQARIALQALKSENKAGGTGTQ